MRALLDAARMAMVSGLELASFAGAGASITAAAGAAVLASSVSDRALLSTERGLWNASHAGASGAADEASSQLPHCDAASRPGFSARCISSQGADSVPGVSHRDKLPIRPDTVLLQHLAVFDGRTMERVPSGLDAIVTEAIAQDYDCICVGEVHDDPVAHAIELELLSKLARMCSGGAAGRGSDDRVPRPSSGGKDRRLSVTLEFFERDTQAVMDEYVQGLCREADMMKDARAWPNYQNDYRPIVELCKSQGLRVVCANAPRRLVSLAGREGAGSLLKLPLESRLSLPPLPYPGASAMYKDKFHWTMQSMDSTPPDEQEETHRATDEAKQQESDAQIPALPGQERSDGEERSCPYIGLSSASSNMLDAQCLWDASMAHSIYKELTRPGGAGKAIVMHICGKFHCEHGLGIPERLSQMQLLPHGAGDDQCSAPVKTLVVCIQPAGKQQMHSDTLPEAAKSMADFLVLTDSTLPRSFDVQHPL